MKANRTGRIAAMFGTVLTALALCGGMAAQTATADATGQSTSQAKTQAAGQNSAMQNTAGQNTAGQNTAGPAKMAPLDSPAVAKVKYEKLAAEVKSGNLDIDWHELRLAARVGGVEGNFDSDNALQSMYQMLKDGKYKDALQQAQTVEEHNVALGDAHFGAMIACDKLGMTAERDREEEMVQRIAHSIMTPGDGKSAATAWTVVWPDEEYFVLRLMGMQVKNQALIEQDGHSYDLMTVTDAKTGAEQAFWFNTDTDMQVLARALGDSGRQ